jgi:hypothetical protein
MLAYEGRGELCVLVRQNTRKKRGDTDQLAGPSAVDLAQNSVCWKSCLAGIPAQHRVPQSHATKRVRRHLRGGDVWSCIHACTSPIPGTTGHVYQQISPPTKNSKPTTARRERKPGPGFLPRCENYTVPFLLGSKQSRKPNKTGTEKNLVISASVSRTETDATPAPTGLELFGAHHHAWGN